MNRSGGDRNRRSTTFAAATAAIVLSLIWVGTAHGQGPAAPRVPMAEEVFKNVQVLKGIPADQFLATMGVFSSGVGKNCATCHTEESGGDWSKYADDTPLKLTTRRMVLMMQQINRANFGGRQEVTCYSCHRGGDRPKVTPSLVALYGVPPDEPEDIVVQAAGAQPADQIFDKYLTAIGGAARIAALTSYSGKGTYKGFDDADTTPLEVYLKAPNQRLWVWKTPYGSDHSVVFDGRDGWVAAPQAERPFPLELQTGRELDGTRLEVELTFPTKIKQALTQVRVGYPASINDRPAQVVQGTTAAGTLVTLYFDTETGLLSRLMRYVESPVGRTVTQYDYEDYRPVAGVRIPFKWTRTWLDGRSVFQLSEVQPNVNVPPARFARPRP